MQGCTISDWTLYPEPPPDAYPTTVSVKTAYGNSHIYYEGGSEFGEQLAAGTSQYSYTLGFAGRGVAELFAEYMITTDVATDNDSCPWNLSLSMYVGKDATGLTGCQGTDGP
jgi:hypothetical protein